MTRPVVPGCLLLVFLFSSLILLPLPSAVACHAGGCSNELYVAGGASLVGIDAEPPMVCVLAPCGDGGVSALGARTHSHGLYPIVMGEIVDFTFGLDAPLGLCGELAGVCVQNADVNCGHNTIWGDGSILFANVTYFIPSAAVMGSLDTCFASSGQVHARFVAAPLA